MRRWEIRRVAWVDDSLDDLLQEGWEPMSVFSDVVEHLHPGSRVPWRTRSYTVVLRRLSSSIAESEEESTFSYPR